MNRRLLLALLAVPLLAACGGSTNKPTTAAPAPETQVAAQPSQGPLGTTGRDGNLAVTVTATHAQQTFPGDPSAGVGPRQATNGWYVIADAHVQNTGTETAQPGQFYIQQPDGTRYEATTNSSATPEFPYTAQLSATDQEAGKLIFDAPNPHGRIVYAAGNLPVYSWTF